jgi:hypothetical protein
MGTFASIATKLKTLCLRGRALIDRQRSAQWASPWANSKVRGSLHFIDVGNLLKLLAESKAAFWMAVNSSVHKPQSDPSFIEGRSLP